MVKRTIRLYPEIFEKYYTDPSIHGLAEKIISYKPDRLTDLLYSAHLNSLEIAMQIVRERSWELSSSHYSIMDILSLAKNKDIDEVLELVRAEKLQLVERPNPENIP
jgi:hypothetical protein